ncbi:hypothetical protein HDU97_003747 [Phlyctochytrium planicorne]|nr:hypothetical protein HDU97_003747 [Phlyctochytrium planicorne]
MIPFPIPLPPELIPTVLEYTCDPIVTIKLESIHLGIPSTLPSYTTAYTSRSITDFPISTILTNPFTLDSLSIPPTTPLSVLSWLTNFRPRIFHKRYGYIVRTLSSHNRLAALQVIASNTASRKHAFGWGEASLAAKSGHLGILEFLYEEDISRFSNTIVEDGVGSGNVELVKWLIQKEIPVTTGSLRKAVSIMNVGVVEMMLGQKLGKFQLPDFMNAKQNVCIEVVEALHRANPKYVDGGLDRACFDGHLSMVQDLISRFDMEPTDKSLESAAAGGHLHICQYLIETHGIPSTLEILASSCERGSLSLAKYLHQNLSPDNLPLLQESSWVLTASLSIKLGILNATIANNLPLIKFLLSLNTELLNCLLPYLPNIMEVGAKTGHASIVAYFHSTLNLGCMAPLVKLASTYGKLEVLEHLNESPCKTCDWSTSLQEACRNGHLGVVKFLHETRPEFQNTLPDLIDDCTSHNPNLPLIKYLHETLQMSYTVASIQNISKKGDLSILKYLLRHSPKLPVASGMGIALANGLSQIFFHLERHRDIHEPNHPKFDFHTFFQLAVSGGNITLVKYFHSRAPLAKCSVQLLNLSTFRNLKFGLESPGNFALEYVSEMGLWEIESKEEAKKNMELAFSFAHAIDATFAVMKRGDVTPQYFVMRRTMRGAVEMPDCSTRRVADYLLGVYSV